MKVSTCFSIKEETVWLRRDEEVVTGISGDETFTRSICRVCELSVVVTVLVSVVFGIVVGVILSGVICLYGPHSRCCHLRRIKDG